VIATIRRQYVGNRPILFKQSDRELGIVAAAADDAARTHNKIDELERGTNGKHRLCTVDVGKVKLAA